MYAKTLNNLLLGLLLFSVSCHGADSRIQISTHYALVEITDRLVRPWGMAFLDENHVLISEKEGGLVIVDLNNRSKTQVHGLPEDLDTRNRQFGDNAGLFGVALDPNFRHNQRVFVAYAAANSASDTTTKVISATLNKHRLTNVQTIFIAEPYSSIRFHYGGGLLTTPDNQLYFTVGERYFDERNQPALPVAQDDNDKRGKIYQVDLNASDLQAKQFAKGIRAAQGLAFDSITKTILFTEHGTRQGDEINLLVPNGNYGWPIITTGKYRSKEYTPPKIEDDFIAPFW